MHPMGDICKIKLRIFYENDDQPKGVFYENYDHDVIQIVYVRWRTWWT